jgi:hypothetical protein
MEDNNHHFDKPQKSARNQHAKQTYKVVHSSIIFSVFGPKYSNPVLVYVLLMYLSSTPTVKAFSDFGPKR